MVQMERGASSGGSGGLLRSASSNDHQDKSKTWGTQSVNHPTAIRSRNKHTWPLPLFQQRDLLPSHVNGWLFFLEAESVTQDGSL